MPDSEVTPRLDAHDLYVFIDRFIRTNKDSSFVEHRWLAAYACDLQRMVWNVKNNQRDVIRKQVNEFRLREIAKARSKLLAEINKLDAEHDKLQCENEADSTPKEYGIQ